MVTWLLDFFGWIQVGALFQRQHLRIKNRGFSTIFRTAVTLKKHHHCSHHFYLEKNHHFSPHVTLWPVVVFFFRWNFGSAPGHVDKISVGERLLWDFHSHHWLDGSGESGSNPIREPEKQMGRKQTLRIQSPNITWWMGCIITSKTKGM